MEKQAPGILINSAGSSLLERLKNRRKETIEFVRGTFLRQTGIAHVPDNRENSSHTEWLWKWQAS
jgi:hypothetical protein